MVIYLAVFSLVVAAQYFAYNASDVALAEVAVGAAITPLIFIIAISKQKDFIVVSLIKDSFINLEEKDEAMGWGYDLLRKFTETYDLKLKVYFRETIEGAFPNRKIDLLIDWDTKNNKYLLIGRRSSILLMKLEGMLSKASHVDLVLLEDEEEDD